MIYKGDSASHPRLGALRKGVVYTLREEEWFYAMQKGSKRNWAYNEPDDQPAFSGVEPARGNYFDLTTVQWKTARAFRNVDAMHKSHLLLALAQMESLGVKCPPITATDSTDTLREVLLASARKAGWLL